MRDRSLFDLLGDSVSTGSPSPVSLNPCINLDVITLETNRMQRRLYLRSSKSSSVHARSEEYVDTSSYYSSLSLESKSDEYLQTSLTKENLTWKEFLDMESDEIARRALAHSSPRSCTVKTIKGNK